MAVVRRLVSPWKLMLAFALMPAAFFAAPAAADAATITVTTSSDVAAGECTLRKAITAANTNAFTDGCPAGSPSPTLDTIQFAGGIGNTIVVATPLPVVLGNLAIVGPGAAALTVSGGDTVAIFHVEETATVTISGLTIADGRCAFACGLLNDGALTLERVAVAHNAAVIEGGTSDFPEGGGILNRATLTLVESSVTANIAKAAGGSSQNAPQGGGIYNSTSGTLTLERSVVSGNSSLASSSGAGSTNATGGGIANFGTLVVRQSTISGNVASGTGSTANNTGAGGGISDANSPSVKVTIDRSTISGNSAISTGTSPNARSGGFNVFGSSFTVRSSTIAGNSAPIGANLTGGVLASFANTIVAEPLGGGANCSVPVTSAGYNLESAASCGFEAAGDKPSTDPLLAPGGPAANGGPTPTIALLEGSPAIDAGLSAVGETVDQRGLTRPVEIPTVADAVGGNGADIGAFEVQLPVVPAPVEPEKQTTPVDPGPPQTPPVTVVPPRDTVAPTATISGLKAKTTARTLRIRFTSSEPGSTFRCKLDAKAYSTCRSPLKTKKLALGPHTFAVIATDPAGNSSRAAKKKFRVVAPGGVR
jgi:hypothetical protein